MKVAMIAGITITLLAGCATQKALQATGGSKADGTVDLSFQYGLFEKPEVNWGEGVQIARSRCQAWGYSDAEPFGGTKSICNQRNGYGDCIDTVVTATYQCTGSK